MSGNKNSARAKDGGKGLGKTAMRAMSKNAALMAEVIRDGIDDDEMRFAQVGKVFGNGRFEVHLADGRITNASIRDLFASKSGTPVSQGTIVLIHLPDWIKDKATNNQKPRAFIEGILDNDSHVPILREKGQLPEWMFSKRDGTGGAAEPEAASFEFVSEEAERAAKGEKEAKRAAEEEEDEEDEDEDEEEEEPASNSSASAGRKTVTKKREQDRLKARGKKIDIDAI